MHNYVRFLCFCWQKNLQILHSAPRFASLGYPRISHEVPYFSWQRSHAVHHSKTNHMTEGETHVPRLAEAEAMPRSFRSRPCSFQCFFIHELHEVDRLIYFYHYFQGALLLGAHVTHEQHSLTTIIDSFLIQRNSYKLPSRCVQAAGFFAGCKRASPTSTRRSLVCWVRHSGPSWMPWVCHCHLCACEPMPSTPDLSYIRSCRAVVWLFITNVPRGVHRF